LLLELIDEKWSVNCLINFPFFLGTKIQLFVALKEVFWRFFLKVVFWGLILHFGHYYITDREALDMSQCCYQQENWEISIIGSECEQQYKNGEISLNGNERERQQENGEINLNGSERERQQENRYICAI
jgi:hypothetical protein